MFQRYRATGVCVSTPLGRRPTRISSSGNTVTSWGQDLVWKPNKQTKSSPQLITVFHGGLTCWGPCPPTLSSYKLKLNR